MTSGQGENQLGLDVAIFRRRLCQKQTCYYWLLLGTTGLYSFVFKILLFVALEC